MQVRSYNFPPLQPRKTNFDRLALDSLERVGLIMSPAQLDTRSLAAARLIHGLGPRDLVTPSLRDLHWLSLEQRITFKLCYLMHLIETGHSPQYLRELVSSISNIVSRSRLRSSGSRRYETPPTRLKFGERCFSFAGPSAWNSLPVSFCTRHLWPQLS